MSSAYTSLVCYRAGGRPPVVTATDLVRFVEQVFALNYLESDTMDLRIRFGQTIDQDNNPTAEASAVKVPGFDWHINESGIPHAQALELLRQPPTSRGVERKRKHALDIFGPKTITEKFEPNIYRAHLSFGKLKEESVEELCRKFGSILLLTEFSFTIDAVKLIDRAKPAVFQVGWMSFTLGGPGQLFPWTYEELIAKPRIHRELNNIRNICRKLWPASTNPVPPKMMEGRRHMGQLWSEPLNAPFDWYWAIQES